MKKAEAEKVKETLKSIEMETDKLASGKKKKKDKKDKKDKKKHKKKHHRDEGGAADSDGLQSMQHPSTIDIRESTRDKKKKKHKHSSESDTDDKDKQNAPMDVIDINDADRPDAIPIEEDILPKRKMNVQEIG